VKTDARQYTAASYETLAPQVNQLNEALRKLEEDNQQLKKALLASHAEQRQRSGKPPRVTAKAEPPAAPAAAPPAAAPPAPGTAAPSTPEERTDDALGRIVGTVNQTREAVEAVRRVPETFQKVLESKGKK